MSLQSDLEITSFYKRKIEPYVAIFILAFLIVGIILLYQDNQLKKDISKNCGYETEKYKCYCLEKDTSYFSKMELNRDEYWSVDGELQNVEMAR